MYLRDSRPCPAPLATSRRPRPPGSRRLPRWRSAGSARHGSLREKPRGRRWQAFPVSCKAFPMATETDGRILLAPRGPPGRRAPKTTPDAPHRRATVAGLSSSLAEKGGLGDGNFTKGWFSPGIVVGRDPSRPGIAREHGLSLEATPEARALILGVLHEALP